MRHSVLLGLSGLTALILSGCPAKPRVGECQSSGDCASQAGYGKVCVEGRCEECAADPDCSNGFVCRANRCVPKPQCVMDSDCPSGQICKANQCIERPAGTCGSDSDCPSGKCNDGLCVAPEARATVPPECASDSSFTIHFGFDETTITADGEQMLRRLAECLSRAPAKRVLVQGNADERGTSQYNVALGERRAEAARMYLQDLGASAAFETVSFGKERPICKQPNEECWAQNRRDDFALER